MKKNKFYLYEFEDNLGEYIIVKKILTKEYDYNVKIISPTSYSNIGTIFLFQEDFVKKELKVDSEEELKKYYPQYFI